MTLSKDCVRELSVDLNLIDSKIKCQVADARDSDFSDENEARRHAQLACKSSPDRSSPFTRHIPHQNNSSLHSKTASIMFAARRLTSVAQRRAFSASAKDVRYPMMCKLQLCYEMFSLFSRSYTRNGKLQLLI
jgi:hypothetical protein